MGSIFLSYRREDAEGQAGRLYDDLVAAFGADAVFMDVAAIQPGRDFRKAIDHSLSSCGVFLSLIGKNWLIAKDSSGERRLDDPADFVRIETAAALKRDIPVIPVLVQGVMAPKPDQLPDDLKELAFRNAMELSHPRWNSDIQLLINSLRPYVSQPEVPAPAKQGYSVKSLTLLAFALAALLGITLFLWPAKKAASTYTPALDPTTTSTADHSDAPAAAKPPTQKTASPGLNQAPKIRSLEYSLAAKQVPFPDNPKRYTYTLSLQASDGTLDGISRVHYDLVYDTNPLSLESSSAPDFSTIYEGWGCYQTVIVTVYFKSPGMQPQKRTFNMCKALN